MNISELNQDDRKYKGWFISVYRRGNKGGYTGDARDMNENQDDIRVGLFGGVGAKKKVIEGLKIQIDHLGLLNYSSPQKKGSVSTLEITKVAQLWYPIIITQLSGEISESKACELLGMTIEGYREQKHQIVQSILKLLNELPCPLTLLLEGMKEKQS